jgi:hypothetical protein
MLVVLCFGLGGVLGLLIVIWRLARKEARARVSETWRNETAYDKAGDRA